MILKDKCYSLSSSLEGLKEQSLKQLEAYRIKERDYMQTISSLNI
jgi:hypothetical protein